MAWAARACGGRRRAGRHQSGRMHRVSGGAGLRLRGSLGVRSAAFRGVWAGLRIDEGAGSGSDAEQDYLEQPVHAGRPEGGGYRHTWAGALRATGSVAWRRHGRGVGPVVAQRLRHRRGAGSVVIRHLRRGVGSVVIRHLGHGRGAGSVVIRHLGHERGTGPVVVRRLRLPGCATARGRHVGASVPLPGAARHSRMVLHLPLPVSGCISPGVGR